MTKIAFIGAGSLGFTSELVRDILTFSAFGRCDHLIDGHSPRKTRMGQKGS